MRPSFDPASATPDERRLELASIFAAGLIRLPKLTSRPDRADPDLGAENLPNSLPNCLELAPDSRLSVHSG
jgi:hypothetical protein